MSFKEQLKKAAESKYCESKKRIEQEHKKWQQQNSVLIDKIKAKLLSVAGNESTTYATIDIRELNLSTADVNELKYYFFNQEDILLYPNGHLLADKKTMQAPYISLGFSWGF